jgi:hypothetical protein
MDKPLRHEDYFAMGEENKRLKQEVVRLTAPKKIWFDGVMATALIAGSIVVCMIVGIGIAYYRHTHPPKPAPPPPPLCYFVGHSIQHPAAWEPLYLFSNKQQEAHRKNDVQITFNTQEEGKAFMKQWNLTGCK